MRYLILAICFALAGCETFVRKEVVVQQNYIVRKASDQQKMLPPYPTPIDVATADQSALAQWILETEKRVLDLETIIRRLVEFYEKPVTAAEKAAVPGTPASGV